MKLKIGLGLCLVAFAAMQSPWAAAAARKVPEVGTSSPKQVVAYHEQALKDIKRYQLPDKQVDTVEQNASQLIATLSSVKQWDQLSPDALQTVTKAHEVVSVTLTEAEEDGLRLICERAPDTGTNLRRKRCETVASRELRARGSKSAIDEMRRRGTQARDQTEISGSPQRGF